VQKLCLVENDREWYEKIKGENKDDSFQYVFANSDSDYIQRKEINSADIIVIDGSYRPECAEYVIKNILEGKQQSHL
jgi:hypothetical protein